MEFSQIRDESLNSSEQESRSMLGAGPFGLPKKILSNVGRGPEGSASFCTSFDITSSDMGASRMRFSTRSETLTVTLVANESGSMLRSTVVDVDGPGKRRRKKAEEGMSPWAPRRRPSNPMEDKSLLGSSSSDEEDSTNENEDELDELTLMHAGSEAAFFSTFSMLSPGQPRLASRVRHQRRDDSPPPRNMHAESDDMEGPRSPESSLKSPLENESSDSRELFVAPLVGSVESHPLSPHAPPPQISSDITIGGHCPLDPG